MARSVYLNNYFGLAFGYAVDTVVSSAEWVYDTEEPPNIIASRVYPASMSGISFSTLLDIQGVGQVGVTGGDGSSFTYAELSLPATGASIRTPWLWSGPYRYVRANGNSATLPYTLSVQHDLYLDTFVSSSNGQWRVYLDSQDLGLFDTYDDDPDGHPAAILIAENVAPGPHTVEIVAQGLDLEGPLYFVYFRSFSLYEHVPAVGGEYLYLGPDFTLEQSVNNFIGEWGQITDYAHTVFEDASAIFYPQLDTGGHVTFRTTTGPDRPIVALYVDNGFVENIDLYAAEPAFPEITVLDAAEDEVGLHKVELRHTGTANPSASGPPYFFYFHSAVIYYERTDAVALELAADFIVKMANSDGAILDAYFGVYYNFEAQSTLSCCGLLAAYDYGVRNPSSGLAKQAYLDTVKNFLLWMVDVWVEPTSDPFTHQGYWEGAYQKDGPGQYSNGILLTVNQIYGINQTRWQDSAYLLPAFLLWWYWKMTGDNTTLAACLPTFRKAVDGVIRWSWDSATGFTYGGWSYQFAPTMFLYHDGVRRYNSQGALLAQYDGANEFFSYDPVYWGSFSSEESINGAAHYTLHTGSYAQFDLTLNAGDTVKWVTITAWNVGIANILVSTDGGQNYSNVGQVDGYTINIQTMREFLIYTAPQSGTYRFRIQHSGTINEAGNTAVGWSRYGARQSADQGDTVMGLSALWMLTRAAKYASLAALCLRRLPQLLWDEDHSRWSIFLWGEPPVMDTGTLYAFAQMYLAWATAWSVLLTPKQYLADGLASLEPYQDAEGGFRTPGYAENDPIYGDAAGYVMGANQLESPNAPVLALAKDFLKGGQTFLSIGGDQVGPIRFSKRYANYFYTVYAGMACLALAAAQNPFDEQLKFSETRMVMPQ